MTLRWPRRVGSTTAGVFPDDRDLKSEAMDGDCNIFASNAILRRTLDAAHGRSLISQTVSCQPWHHRPFQTHYLLETEKKAKPNFEIVSYSTICWIDSVRSEVAEFPLALEQFPIAKRELVRMRYDTQSVTKEPDSVFAG